MENGDILHCHRQTGIWNYGPKGGFMACLPSTLARVKDTFMSPCEGTPLEFHEEFHEDGDVEEDEVITAMPFSQSSTMLLLKCAWNIAGHLAGPPGTMLHPLREPYVNVLGSVRVNRVIRESFTAPVLSLNRRTRKALPSTTE